MHAHTLEHTHYTLNALKQRGCKFLFVLFYAPPRRFFLEGRKIKQTKISSTLHILGNARFQTILAFACARSQMRFCTFLELTIDLFRGGQEDFQIYNMTIRSLTILMSGTFGFGA